MAERPSTKISLSNVAKLEQLLDQAPVVEATAVSKRRAVGMLAPRLYELRARGYAWRDVAAWLTEHGLTVSVPALQRYLRGHDPGTGNRSTTHRSSPRSPVGRPRAPVARGTAPRPMDAPVPSSAPAPSSVPASGTPSGPPSAARRATFQARPDTEDL